VIGISDPGSAVYVQNDTVDTYLLRLVDDGHPLVYSIAPGGSGLVSLLGSDSGKAFVVLRQDCSWVQTQTFDGFGEWLIVLKPDSDTPTVEVQPTQGPSDATQAFETVDKC
jgi:hypothetical protein